MEEEKREVYYDSDLQVEAYHLSGIVQKFPNHFHEYYVIGYLENGRRHLWCKGNEYDLKKGDLILFNPRDNHYCAPIDEQPTDFRTINIGLAQMRAVSEDITGAQALPFFAQNIYHTSDIPLSIQMLYDAILQGAPRLEKEEFLYNLIGQLFEDGICSIPVNQFTTEERSIRTVCTYIETHYDQNLSLEDLLSQWPYSKSYLLRSFTRQTGVSPYRYLQSVRLTKAKQFLRQGLLPIEVAQCTGFTDQSHFTNYFKEFIGVTPKQYQRIFSLSRETMCVHHDSLTKN